MVILSARSPSTTGSATSRMASTDRRRGRHASPRTSCCFGQGGTSPSRCTPCVLVFYFLVLAPHLGFASTVTQESQTELQRLVAPTVRGSLLRHLSDALPSSGASDACVRDSLAVVRAGERAELWALKMLDASARVPSGLLRGNVNQFGDFDECLSVTAQADQDGAQDRVSASYCLSSVELRVSDAPAERIRQLLLSHTPFRSNFTDPGHRVPRFSAAHVAVCAPTSCTSADLRVGLERVLNGVLVEANASSRIGVHVAPEMCRHPGHVEPADGVGASLARWIFRAVIFAVLTCTVLDLASTSPGLHDGKLGRAAMSFSLRRNLQQLVRADSGKDDVGCVHGVRALCAFGLLLSHKSVAGLFPPYVNRTAASEVLGMPWSIIGRTAILYTDSFIILSGVLAAKSLLRQLDRTGKVPFVRRVVDRYIRLTPTLVGLIVFCTLVLPGLGSGPLWGLVIQPHAALCRQHWWRNMLYIHNYFGFENMCLTHTHQLGIDMQLFLAAPLLVLPLWRWPRAGSLFLICLAAASTALRYSVVFNNQLSTIVFFGVSVSQMFRTANLSYILPTHRATVYIMGILVGYVLHRHPGPFKMPYVLEALSWTLFAGLGVVAVVGPYDAASADFQYDAHTAAMYAAFAPILWASLICFGILACARMGGPMNDLLCWRGFRVFTRIAYTVYLTQFPAFFYNVGTTRHADFYSIGTLLNMGEFAFIMGASGVLTVTFEMPFQGLWEVITEKTPVPEKVKTQGDSTVETIQNDERDIVKLTPGKVRLRSSSAAKRA